MIVHAARRPRTPHDHTGEAEITEWSVEAPDYATAKAEIDATVGEAEVLLYYRPER